MTAVLDRCNSFEDLRVWPTQPRLKAAAWLDNFTVSERPYAESLLLSFMYFNECMCGQLLRSAFSGIARHFYQYEGTERRKAWSEFLRTAIFTYPADDNPSKSGPTIIRLTRQELGFEEHRMYTPDEALGAIADGKSRYVVFVDDFVGSGDQFSTTWNEEKTRLRSKISFKQLCVGNVTAFYVPYIATQYGLDQIRTMCSGNCVTFPGQVLSNNYCAFAKDSLIWNDGQRANAEQVIYDCSQRAGLKEHRGHHGLGFAVAVHRSIPDVTLPLFLHRSRSWCPLMERK
ncbi:phosphoribosyltransferase-like protein [Gimibacter soli]|uniref:PRTase-CE domain-containing protein n=1 Tax=Gimibacter soli TaxID=3024400 RepID=A0AAE9XSX3_9PROT|nr:hypothetical protein [Gimibacter soli]WCL53495.1 hypothetical protein PH603_13200 [Gimibacter soli]